MLGASSTLPEPGALEPENFPIIAGKCLSHAYHALLCAHESYPSFSLVSCIRIAHKRAVCSQNAQEARVRHRVRSLRHHPARAYNPIRRYVRQSVGHSVTRSTIEDYLISLLQQAGGKYGKCTTKIQSVPRIFALTARRHTILDFIRNGNAHQNRICANLLYAYVRLLRSQRFCTCHVLHTLVDIHDVVIAHFIIRSTAH